MIITGVRLCGRHLQLRRLLICNCEKLSISARLMQRLHHWPHQLPAGSELIRLLLLMGQRGRGERKGAALSGMCRARPRPGRPEGAPEGRARLELVPGWARLVLVPGTAGACPGPGTANACPGHGWCLPRARPMLVLGWARLGSVPGLGRVPGLGTAAACPGLGRVPPSSAQPGPACSSSVPGVLSSSSSSSSAPMQRRTGHCLGTDPFCAMSPLDSSSLCHEPSGQQLLAPVPSCPRSCLAGLSLPPSSPSAELGAGVAVLRVALPCPSLGGTGQPMPPSLCPLSLCSCPWRSCPCSQHLDQSASSVHSN